jgi:hypothetical protein
VKKKTGNNKGGKINVDLAATSQLELVHSVFPRRKNSKRRSSIAQVVQTPLLSMSNVDQRQSKSTKSYDFYFSPPPSAPQAQPVSSNARPPNRPHSTSSSPQLCHETQLPLPFL